jgi:hypothetical protein
MSSIHFARLMQPLRSDVVDFRAILFGQMQFRLAHDYTSKPIEWAIGELYSCFVI